SSTWTGPSATACCASLLPVTTGRSTMPDLNSGGPANRRSSTLKWSAPVGAELGDGVVGGLRVDDLVEVHLAAHVAPLEEPVLRRADGVAVDVAVGVHRRDRHLGDHRAILEGSVLDDRVVEPFAVLAQAAHLVIVAQPADVGLREALGGLGLLLGEVLREQQHCHGVVEDQLRPGLEPRRDAATEGLG